MTALTAVCGTTLMNVGLILTPVSIYQMSRGALVLWVGILSVMFLGRRLWLYQWSSLVIVTFGVCLVGLSGSLVKSEVVVADGKVALGVALILFAQVFTATQYVVEEKIMSTYKVEPLVSDSIDCYLLTIGRCSSGRGFRHVYHPRSDAISSYLVAAQITVFRYSPRLASDYLEYDRDMDRDGHLHQYRQLQLFRAQCHEQSLGYDEEHD